MLRKAPRQAVPVKFVARAGRAKDAAEVVNNGVAHSELGTVDGPEGAFDPNLNPSAEVSLAQEYSADRSQLPPKSSAPRTRIKRAAKSRGPKPAPEWDDGFTRNS